MFTKCAIPMLKKNKGGSLINISSTAGVFGFPLRSPYAASKAANISFTKTAAMELGKYKKTKYFLKPVYDYDQAYEYLKQKNKETNVLFLGTTYGYLLKNRKIS